MAVEKTSQRKLVLFSYDKARVTGRQISVQAAHANEDPLEKKNVPNKGVAFVTFGHGFVGESHIKVVGSSGGEDEGTVHVD